MKSESSRREFIKEGIGALAAAGLAGCASDDSASTPAVTPTPSSRMGTRPLGQTGYQVALFSLGGQAALDTTGQDSLADQIINRALDLGVNYSDTAPNYYDSEIYIGRVVAIHAPVQRGHGAPRTVDPALLA
jgi:hypothetical protein